MLKLFVIGNLGKDAIVNTTQNGKTVINFSCAHTEQFKDAQGNKKENTVWVDCSWWTESTNVVPYLKKGVKVFVEGTPAVKSFERNDGSQGTALTLRVVACQLLGGGNNANGNTQPSQQAPAQETASKNNTGFAQQAPYTPAEEVADDLPF